MRQRHAERAVGRIEHRAALGVGLGELAPHAGLLRALSGEQEGDAVHQRTTDAAQVSPAPNAAISTMWSRAMHPRRTASSRAIGIEAAEVLP